MLIGKLAAATGVNIETIRYYERVALLPAPARTTGGHRVYDAGHIQRLAFIRRSRELGFSLEDIRALIALSDDKGDCSAKELTLRHLANVRGKIASLKKLERALRGMTDACKPGNQNSCPKDLEKAKKAGRTLKPRRRLVGYPTPLSATGELATTWKEDVTRAAMLRLASVCDKVASGCQSGELVSGWRPHDGGDVVTIPQAWWNTEGFALSSRFSHGACELLSVD
jgi:MerR family mercuric resistance operon transcriptional regulator